MVRHDVVRRLQNFIKSGKVMEDETNPCNYRLSQPER